MVPKSLYVRRPWLLGLGVGIGLVLGVGVCLGIGTVDASIYAYLNSDVCAGRFNQSCYIIVNESLTWQAASSRCRAMFGHLATIENQTENNVIHSLIASKFYM